MPDHALLSREELPADILARLDLAYHSRTRRQCSREDFDAGYLAALADYGLAARISTWGSVPSERSQER